MFCTNCGAENNDNATFCTNCGNTLNSNNNQQVVNKTPVKTFVDDENVNVAEPSNVAGKVLGIISMILGILSIPFSCCYSVGMVYAIPGLILGIIGGKKSKEAGFTNGMAKAGVILSIIGLVCCVLYYIYLVIIAIIGTLGNM